MLPRTALLSPAAGTVAPAVDQTHVGQQGQQGGGQKGGHDDPGQIFLHPAAAVVDEGLGSGCGGWRGGGWRGGGGRGVGDDGALSDGGGARLKGGRVAGEHISQWPPLISSVVCTVASPDQLCCVYNGLP